MIAENARLRNPKAEPQEGGNGDNPKDENIPSQPFKIQRSRYHLRVQASSEFFYNK